MSNENVVSMVDSLTSGDNVAAQDAFKSALTDKIGQALDDKRQTVANDWLNAGNEQEDRVTSSELTNGASALDSDSVISDTTDAEVDLGDEPFEIDSQIADEVKTGIIASPQGVDMLDDSDINIGDE